MNRHSKLPARFLLVLLGTILIVAGLTSVSLATETSYHGGYFDVVEATASTAYFSINSSCDGRDHNCTVKVTGTMPQDRTEDTNVLKWKALLEARKESEASCVDTGSGDTRYRDFENCWPSPFEVTWPTINPDDDFEITPYCKSGDDVCAEELIVCFNANDCDDNSYGTKSWSQVGELWDKAGSCLYDDDEDDVWECLDEEFDDWLDENLRSHHDYDDLEDEEDEDRGFTLEDYEDDLDDVGDQPSTRRSETTLERYKRVWASRTPKSIYTAMSDVDDNGPSFRLTKDEYLTVNFTEFLESTRPYQVCNTTIGCVTVATYSNAFRSYMKNFHIIIQDSKVLRCMDRAGWDVEDDHAIPFDNADLILCDERMKVANDVCPAQDTGAGDDLFKMWDNGLLRGILPDSYATSLRLQVERGRDRTPECLCAAGFLEKNFVITSENTADPWERSGAMRTEDVCD